MDNLLLVILVIIFVFMCSQLMKDMCGQRVVEGIFGSNVTRDDGCGKYNQCGYGCGSVLVNQHTFKGDDYHCRKCPAGKYSRSEVKTKDCDACPGNTTTTPGTTGASSISDCNACKGNYYKSGTDTDGKATCATCLTKTNTKRPFSLSGSTSEDDCIKPDPRYCLPYIELKRKGKTDDEITNLIKKIANNETNYNLTEIGADGQWTKHIAGKYSLNKTIFNDDFVTQFKAGEYCLNCLDPYYMTHDGTCATRGDKKCPIKDGGWWGPVCSDVNNNPVPRSLL